MSASFQELEEEEESSEESEDEELQLEEHPMLRTLDPKDWKVPDRMWTAAAAAVLELRKPVRYLAFKYKTYFPVSVIYLFILQSVMDLIDFILNKKKEQPNFTKSLKPRSWCIKGVHISSIERFNA